jgi:hypothetical protein
VDKYDEKDHRHQGEYVQLAEDALGQNRQIANIIRGNESQNGGSADNVSQSRSGSQEQDGEDYYEPGQESLLIYQNLGYLSYPIECRYNIFWRIDLFPLFKPIIPSFQYAIIPCGSQRGWP